jgi:predicted permease
MLGTFFQRLFSAVRKSRLDSDLRDELESHLDALTEENLRRGMSPAEARAAARREFGGVEQTRQLYREQRGFAFLDNLAQDIRYALRGLANRPGFAAVAILTLALGIGANTAIFSLLNGLALRNLDVPHPEQLVRFGVHAPDDSYTALSVPMFEELSREQTVCSGTFGYSGEGIENVEIAGTLSRADVWPVDGNYFSELGAVPQLGRLLTPDDVNLRSTPRTLAVLGFGYWQRRFGGRADVIGTIVRIEGHPFTIIGVTRADFAGTSVDVPPEILIPLNAERVIDGRDDFVKSPPHVDALAIEAYGRLKPGVSLAAARVQLESLWPSLQKALMPAEFTPQQKASFLSLQMKVESGAKGGSFLRHRFTQPLYIVLAIASFVLLIACVNLASLLLARAAARWQEIGVRVALGAGRARLFQQFLTESVTLSIFGTLCGSLLAYWSSRALSNWIVGEIFIVPGALNLRADARILGFTASLSRWSQWVDATLS